MLAEREPLRSQKKLFAADIYSRINLYYCKILTSR